MGIRSVWGSKGKGVQAAWSQAPFGRQTRSLSRSESIDFIIDTLKHIATTTVQLANASAPPQEPGA